VEKKRWFSVGPFPYAFPKKVPEKGGFSLLDPGGGDWESTYGGGGDKALIEGGQMKTTSHVFRQSCQAGSGQEEE